MLPPTIPTSFVPRPTDSPRRFHADFTNAFNILAYVIFFASIALAIGVFFYGRILATTKENADAALAKAEQGIDPSTAEAFVRLSDRLTSGKKLLAGHIALSGFFSTLSSLLPSTVRLTALHLSVDDATGAVKLDGSGSAKDFNSLASASASLTKDNRIKDVIFSGIAVNPKDGTVSFALSALLDPKLVAFSAAPPSSMTSVPTATGDVASTTTP